MDICRNHNKKRHSEDVSRYLLMGTQLMLASELDKDVKIV